MHLILYKCIIIFLYFRCGNQLSLIVTLLFQLSSFYTYITIFQHIHYAFEILFKIHKCWHNILIIQVTRVEMENRGIKTSSENEQCYTYPFHLHVHACNSDLYTFKIYKSLIYTWYDYHFPSKTPPPLHSHTWTVFSVSLSLSVVYGIYYLKARWACLGLEICSKPSTVT